MRASDRGGGADPGDRLGIETARRQILLRRMGVLEARSPTTAAPLYGPADNLRRASARGAQPLDGVIHAVEALDGRRPAPVVAPTGESPGEPRPSVSLKHP